MKIAVLLSGGVDSSVAVRLLQEAGHQVTAFYLKIWLEDELSYLGNCPWEEDLAYVRATCTQLGIPLEVVSLQRAYWDRVVAATIAHIKAGFTPNPDILCNQQVKFGAFYEHPDFALFDKVATGHYAQVVERDGRCALFQSPDPIKDQTYFLSALSQAQLARALFPIGHLPKQEVRALAHTYGLPTRDRKDSQGICFLGKLKFRDFVQHHVGTRPGNFVEFETGRVMGEHEGFWFHTIGQRQGIGLSGGPWYVVSKDVAKNIVFISRSYHAAHHERRTFTVNNLSWISGQMPTDAALSVKLRHGPAQPLAKIAYPTPGEILVTLPENDQGIAPGQYAVFYRGNECLGGGTIKESRAERNV